MCKNQIKSRVLSIGTYPMWKLLRLGVEVSVTNTSRTKQSYNLTLKSCIFPQSQLTIGVRLHL